MAIGPREWSPRFSGRTREGIKKQVEDWLENYELSRGVRVYTQQEWIKRGERYGNDAVVTITAEGTFNHIMNYPESREDIRLIEKFKSFLDHLGLWSEQGFSWTWHLYAKEETGPIMGEAEPKKPLLTLLSSIAMTRPRLVLRQADRYFSIADVIAQARRDRKKSEKAREVLDAPIYSAEQDPQDNLIIWRDEEGQRKVTFVEARSTVKTDPWG